MTEADRVNLYNDLCDFRDELSIIQYPSQTKRIDILSRAIAYVHGNHATWLRIPESITETTANGLPFVFPMQCSSCLFAWGRSDYNICPRCGAKMK